MWKECHTPLHCMIKQGKSEGVDICDQPSNFTPTGFKSSIFSARATLKFDRWPKKTKGHLFYIWSYSPETRNSGENLLFFVSCDLQIWWMTSKNERAPLPYVRPCASFQSHWWIQIGVTVRKRSIWVKIGDILSQVTLKYDGWSWKTIEHLFYTTPSFVYHFQTIGEFKLELQSGNTQFRSKFVIFCPVWPWNLTDDLEKQYAASSFVHHFVAISEFKLELQFTNAQFG